MGAGAGVAAGVELRGVADGCFATGVAAAGVDGAAAGALGAIIGRPPRGM